MSCLRSFAAVVVPAIVLVTPARSDADLLLSISGGEAFAVFGLVPFQVDEQVQHFPVSGNVGFAHLLSGPLVDLDVDAANGLTSYSYGPGTLTLTLTLEDPHQNLVTGTFTAVTSPFGFTVCEGCDNLSNGGTANDFEITFGSGEFDAVFAHAMGFARTGHSGFINFGLEDIDGDPASEQRSGFDNGGYFPLQISVAEVPEPSLLLLLAAGGAAISARRGISRARTSARR